MKKIWVIGLWHQGVGAAACMAEIGYKVIGIDANEEAILTLNAGKSPIYEPGLDEIISLGISKGNLSFKSHIPKDVSDTDLIVISHDTPVDDNDLSDLSEIYNCLDELGQILHNDALIHITAQVPVGTCEKLANRAYEYYGKTFNFAYSPENLRLGQALNLYKSPALPVIGTTNKEIFERVKKIYEPFGSEWFYCDLKTGEMLKHALNSYLAISITFANELGNLCDEIGVDGHKVGQLLKLEPRVGSKAMLKPGLGFSGGTLARDIQTLRSLGDACSVDTLLLDALWSVNKNQNKMVETRLLNLFNGKLSNKKICILGLTYKVGTSTLRRSAALELIENLTYVGVEISCSDPKADTTELENLKNVSYFNDPYESANGADAIVIMTGWPEFKNLDLSRLQDLMIGDVFFDAVDLFDDTAISDTSLNYYNLGSGKFRN